MGRLFGGAVDVVLRSGLALDLPFFASSIERYCFSRGLRSDDRNALRSTFARSVRSSSITVA